MLTSTMLTTFNAYTPKQYPLNSPSFGQRPSQELGISGTLGYLTPRMVEDWVQEAVNANSIIVGDDGTVILYDINQTDTVLENRTPRYKISQNNGSFRFETLDTNRNYCSFNHPEYFDKLLEYAGYRKD